jgi:hypothetical protein
MNILLNQGHVWDIQPRGEEEREIESNTAWVNRFRKLLVRFEKKACNYVLLIQFALAVIVWRKQ